MITVTPLVGTLAAWLITGALSLAHIPPLRRYNS